MPLNVVAGQRLADALGTAELPVATQLCGRDADAYIGSVNNHETIVVGCTQERALFEELAQEREAAAPLRFVNLRETAGHSSQAYASLPKMAALLADAALPAPEPVPKVSYTSQGRTLIVGAAHIVLAWAEKLHAQLDVTVLFTDGAGATALPLERDYPVFSGTDVAVNGWLGEFKATWRQSNPIDLDLCVRCNACIAACPEEAIDLRYQVDEEKCRRHGDCVRACGAIGAIDFARTDTVRSGEFDLVFDLSATPLLPMHQPPQGYFVADAADPYAQIDAVMRLTQMVGEFEKPKYFRYKERLCAHSRNRKTGCNACIEICSAQAIRGDSDRIKVDPHLCMGCGACTTVCPSGALGYAYPDAPYSGRRLKTILTTYAKAGGESACMLFHSNEHGAALIASLGRLAAIGKGLHGMPAHAIPLGLHHAASAGIELWLGALCYGATGVAVMVTPHDAPAYVAALKQQTMIAQQIMSGLGYAGSHFTVIDAETPEILDAALRQLPQGAIPATTATFHIAPDKRNALDFVLTHLYEHAPLKGDAIPLPLRAPFGTLTVNRDACTLCMACAGACPTSALMTTPDRPALRFIEKNCVQCGLCANTCPEKAIELVPRLALNDAAKKPVVLNETEPFHCIRCNKPFGTVKLIETMLAKLAGHGAFAENLDRLRMCGDCRVVDMMMAKKEMTATALERPRPNVTRQG